MNSLASCSAGEACSWLCTATRPVFVLPIVACFQAMSYLALSSAGGPCNWLHVLPPGLLPARAGGARREAAAQGGPSEEVRLAPCNLQGEFGHDRSEPARSGHSRLAAKPGASRRPRLCKACTVQS